jgi:formylglycine-generating enzyme required for sulfatase activity
MVYIPGGTFEMGDVMGDVMGDNEANNELPIHEVTLDAFYMGACAVTFEEYDAFCNSTGKIKPGDNNWGRSKRPVINVSWYDAVEYCNWRSLQEGLEPVYDINGDDVAFNRSARGYRLPTEAEWEYAAREEGKKARFGNGKNIADPEEINFDGNSFFKKSYSRSGKYRKETVVVGSLPPNALGLHEMSGNVWEWCWDWHRKYPYEFQSDSQGTDYGSARVLRGGSWINTSAYLRCANRSDGTPDALHYDIGFRLARSFR